MSNAFEIQSHKGKYAVFFPNDFSFENNLLESSHFILDKKIAELYADELKDILLSPSVLIIEALETNKSLEKFPSYVDHLVKNKLRRHQRLIAIGGGIIQDITCFLAANILRGVEWWYFPTTLLSQADSCIGSKSSINCGNIKNILGTFTPPKKVFIYNHFLKTLALSDIRSGIGEMLKVHAIAGEVSFSAIQKDYQHLFYDQQLMCHYIYKSLEIKKTIIEIDEFDQDTRHVMNYGHTFGHAIESATSYEIPHGIAVTIGMDMANYIAKENHLTSQHHYQRMHATLKENYVDFLNQDINFEKFISAIMKDKKNIDNEKIALILLNTAGIPQKVFLEKNVHFHRACQTYLESGRHL